jgi:hypothetical protein
MVGPQISGALADSWCQNKSKTAVWSEYWIGLDWCEEMFMSSRDKESLETLS